MVFRETGKMRCPFWQIIKQNSFFSGVFFLIFLCGCRTVPVSIFEYAQNNDFIFDRHGHILPLHECKDKPTPPRSSIHCSITAEGCAVITEKGKILYKGDPGDRVVPLQDDGDFLYLFTEKDASYLNAVKLHKKTGITQLISSGEKDCAGIIFHKKLHGIIYDGNQFSCIFFTPEYKAMHRKLIQNFKTEHILWHSYTPDGNRFLVQVFFPDRMNISLCCDLKKQSWEILSKPLKQKQLTLRARRELIYYQASDGKYISAILTHPPGKDETAPCPLVVFPHGGPGARSMLNWDVRSEYLAKQGFLILSPNYRGSSGQGKQFKRDGWKAGGIRRSLADIADGTVFLWKKGIADRKRTFIFGGSWGAYCTLAMTALYPDYYKAAAAFFGPTDLTAMLREFLPESGAEKGLDILQYGNIADPETCKELKEISPYFLAHKIKTPILLFHFRDDPVISFSQSERFYYKMKHMKKKIFFTHGNGQHGFPSASEEEKAYSRMIDFFRKHFK